MSDTSSHWVKVTVEAGSNDGKPAVTHTLHQTNITAAHAHAVLGSLLKTLPALQEHAQTHIK